MDTRIIMTLVIGILIGMGVCHFMEPYPSNAQGYLESRQQLNNATGQVDVWAGSARENRLLLQQEQFLNNQYPGRLPCR